MQEKEITINNVMEFIFQNCNDTEMMDKINRITFPFTSKFDNYTTRNSSKRRIKVWWGYQPSYEDLRELIERDEDDF